MKNKSEKSGETGGLFSSKSRYNLSLYILIPFIFMGMSVLSGIIAFQFSKSPYKLSGDFILWGVIGVALALLCGLAITALILGPMRRFVKEAEKLPLFADALTDKTSLKANEIDYFNLISREVTKLLSKVKAKELFPETIGQSEVMRGLFSQILKVAPTDSTVLIMGESGTGKELAATSIYDHSLRKDKPFVKLNCVAIPEGLLESELFGHEKGAFTGAESRKIGKFEMADGGTILLDEIGDMPLSTQAKLLRVLQEREFERVGGTETIRVDVRFIAASNKNLPEMVKRGEFREDLYYRINVFTLVLPPLRERKEDIPLLVEYFLEKAPRETRISPGTSKALEKLMGYKWPGNVRELRNIVERAALMSEDGIIEPADIINIDLEIKEQGRDENHGQELRETGEGETSIDIDNKLQKLEKKLIVDALINTKGVQSKAAELLGIKERSLWHRIKKYNIDPASFK